MTHLTEDQIASYQDNGFLAGLDIFDPDEVARIRAEIEALERDHAEGAGGHDMKQFMRINGHLVLPLLAEIARTPEILDKVESLLGPNLLAWSVELFIKEPGTTKVVSWHQDLTYWGMGETDDEVTAWIALSDVSVKAGCMRFIPGSHKGGIVDHNDTFHADNLLSRGQEIAGVDESKAVHGPLKPGQMSLHHGRCFHASGANMSSDRRIGLVIRYVTPEVRLPELGRDYAMLVRGVDEMQGWINVAGARSLMHPVDVALYDKVLEDQAKVLAAGAEKDVNLYKKQKETA